MPAPLAGATPLLVEIAHPDIDIDLAYATPDNLAGRILYAEHKALLRPEAVAALYSASAGFAAQGLRIRVLDAYRPAAIQRVFWDLLPDADYVADPVLGSDHQRGIAVDLTLTDANGALDMGTGFDASVVQSHHGRSDIPAAAIRNRLNLREGMMAAGFVPLATEWWHYALPRRPEFALIDDSIGALQIVA